MILTLARPHRRPASLLGALACALLALVLLAGLVPASASAASIRKVQVTRNIVFAGTPEAPVALDVWKPAGARRAPVLVLLHGGGWARSGRAEWDANGWTGSFARAGYVVVNADYRLACRNPPQPGTPPNPDGKSAAPTKADIALCNHTMDDALADANSAMRWATSNARTYGGDPTRIVIMGGSAGAHLALLVASEGDSPRSLRGVVAFSPPADLEWMARAKIKLADAVTAAIGCEFLACPARWREFSPMRQVAAGADPVPTYIMRSRRDLVTPFAQVQRYAQVAIRRGANVTLREPMDSRTACHGPWSCERYGVKGKKGVKLRADVLAWLHSTALAPTARS